MAITKSYSIPGYGTVFTAPPNTELPDLSEFDKDLDTVGDFENLGHTSSENPIELAVDGGDATSKRSWLRDNLITIYEDTTWSATGNAIQTDKETVQKIYGGWDTDDALGSVVPSGKKGTELALVILSQDDTGRMLFYVPSVNLSFGDAPSFDVENFFEIPFSATFQAPETGVLPTGPDGSAGLFSFYGPDAFDVSGS